MGRAIGLTVLGMLLFFGYTWVIFYIGVKGHELAVRNCVCGWEEWVEKDS